MVVVDKGTMLIAEPFLKDPNFQRTVVLICEHEPAGSFGITINRVMRNPVAEYMEGIGNYEIPLFDGGPVGRDHIHFLHRLPGMIEGGKKIAEGIYWGGDLETARFLINSGKTNETDIRFYLGYSGWGTQQLDQEMEEKSWLTIPAKSSLVFQKNPGDIWKEAVKHLGDEFRPIIHYPRDPELN